MPQRLLFISIITGMISIIIYLAKMKTMPLIDIMEEQRKELFALSSIINEFNETEQ